MLSGGQKHVEIIFKVGDTEIRPHDTVDYLGVMLDRHLEWCVACKATQTASPNDKHRRP